MRRPELANNILGRRVRESFPNGRFHCFPRYPELLGPWVPDCNAFERRPVQVKHYLDNWVVRLACCPPPGPFLAAEIAKRVRLLPRPGCRRRFPQGKFGGHRTGAGGAAAGARAGPGCGLLGSARVEQAGLIWGVSFLGALQETEIYGEERARTSRGADAAYDIAVPVGLQVQRLASGTVIVVFPEGEVVRSDDQRPACLRHNPMVIPGEPTWNPGLAAARTWPTPAAEWGSLRLCFLGGHL